MQQRCLAGPRPHHTASRHTLQPTGEYCQQACRLTPTSPGQVPIQAATHLHDIHAVHMHSRHAKGGPLLVDPWLVVTHRGRSGGARVVHANSPSAVHAGKEGGRASKRAGGTLSGATSDGRVWRAAVAAGTARLHSVGWCWDQQLAAWGALPLEPAPAPAATNTQPHKRDDSLVVLYHKDAGQLVQGCHVE